MPNSIVQLELNGAGQDSSIERPDRHFQARTALTRLCNVGSLAMTAPGTLGPVVERAKGAGLIEGSYRRGAAAVWL